MVNMQKSTEMRMPTHLSDKCYKFRQVLKAYFQGEMWPPGRLLVLKRNTVILNQCF